MFKAHDYAFQIEVTLNSIFDCERDEMGGIADTNFIEKQPFIPIVLIMGNFYNKSGPSFKNKIDGFFEKYNLEMGKSITQIGEEKIKYILEDFKKIVSTI